MKKEWTVKELAKELGFSPSKIRKDMDTYKAIFGEPGAGHKYPGDTLEKFHKLIPLQDSGRRASEVLALYFGGAENIPDVKIRQSPIRLSKEVMVTHRLHPELMELINRVLTFLKIR